MTKCYRVWLNRRSSILLSASLAAAASAGQYRATELGLLEGGAWSEGFAVNEQGQVVGAADTPNNYHAFIWDMGVMTDLGILQGGTQSVAFSINNNGVIVGRADDADGHDRAVRWQLISGEWQIEDIGDLGGTFALATRVNDLGKIVGYSATDTGPSHGFIWENGSMLDVGTLNYSGPFAFSQALGLNNLGEVVGFAYMVLGGPEHGYVYSGGAQQDITPPGRFSLAQGYNINDLGVIGGYISSADTNGALRAAYYSANDGWTVIPLFAGVNESYGYDINDNGDMVGIAFRLEPPPDFRAYVFHNGATYDLNVVTINEPAQIIEAWDISNSGLIAANSFDDEGLSIALLLTPSEDCLGDLNNDGVVAIDDLAISLSHFGSTDAMPEDGDLDEDGDVDIEDLSTLLGLYGIQCD